MLLKLFETAPGQQKRKNDARATRPSQSEPHFKLYCPLLEPHFGNCFGTKQNKTFAWERERERERVDTFCRHRRCCRWLVFHDLWTIIFGCNLVKCSLSLSLSLSHWVWSHFHRFFYSFFGCYFDFSLLPLCLCLYSFVVSLASESNPKQKQNEIK